MYDDICDVLSLHLCPSHGFHLHLTVKVGNLMNNDLVLQWLDCLFSAKWSNVYAKSQLFSIIDSGLGNLPKHINWRKRLPEEKKMSVEQWNCQFHQGEVREAFTERSCTAALCTLKLPSSSAMNTAWPQTSQIQLIDMNTHRRNNSEKLNVCKIFIRSAAHLVQTDVII